MAETVTRYVTRWALTAGIRKLEGEIVHGDHGDYFSQPGAFGVFVPVKEASQTEFTAQVVADQMLKKKIEHAKKALAGLEKRLGKPFKVVEE